MNRKLIHYLRYPQMTIPWSDITFKQLSVQKSLSGSVEVAELEIGHPTVTIIKLNKGAYRIIENYLNRYNISICRK